VHNFSTQLHLKRKQYNNIEEMVEGKMKFRVILMAAPSQTVGRSGLHWSNSTCTVLTGEVVRHSDAYSGLVKETFNSGLFIGFSIF